MSTTLTPNGTPRKQLADQLDRFDGQMARQDVQMDRADAVLDALAEGLNGAVADATREGIKEAVITLLTDGHLRAALHQASSAPPRDRPPSPWQRLLAGVRRATARAKQYVSAAAAAVAARVSTVVAAVGQGVSRFRSGTAVRTAIRVLVAGVALIATTRSGAARRLLAVANKARTVIGDRLAPVCGWIRSLRPVPAAG
jgi:hypothetical protein